MSYLCNQTDKSGFHDMHWIILILAGLCEVAFAYCLPEDLGLLYDYFAHLNLMSLAAILVAAFVGPVGLHF